MGDALHPRLTMEPATLFCDEAGFGAPHSGQGSRLWVCAVCVPDSRRADLATLQLSSEKEEARRQIQAAADEALKVVAAGRPTCPLCKQPMDLEGHMCVRTNGHKAVTNEL